MTPPLVVIGAGSIGQRHRQNLAQLFPEHPVLLYSARACGTTPPSATMQEIVDMQPLFVVIASAATCHAAQAHFLLTHRIAVLVEKPLSAALPQAQALLQFARQQQVPVAVAYCLRFLPAAQIVKSLLAEHAVGDIYTVQSHVGQYLPAWRANTPYQQSVSASRALGGGVLNELSHELDYLHWLFGPLKLLHAELGQTALLQLDVEDHALLLLQSQQPFAFPLTVQLDFLQPIARRACVILGTNGRLEWDLIANTVTQTTFQGQQVVYRDDDYPRNQMYLSMLASFYHAASTNTFDEQSLADALATVQLIDQCRQNNWRQLNIPADKDAP